MSNETTAYILDRLIQKNAAVFRPVGESRGIDLAVRGQDGQYVELLCLGGTPASPRAFRAPRFRRRPNLLMACAVLDEGKPSDAWLLPSGVFERFGVDQLDGTTVLDLDADEDGPLHERLAVYRERWHLVTDFARLRSTLEDPIALKVRLAMG